MRPETEQRDVALALKALDEAGAFSGYASVFDTLDSEHDVIALGAFTRTLREQDGGRGIKLLWQHDPREPIGRFDEIIEDGYGLFVRGRLLLDVRRAAEAYALLRADALSGLSIGYRALRYTVDPQSGVRTITDLALFEISLVTFPANRLAQVHAVKARPLKTIRALEAALRDAGLSRAEAKAVAAYGFGGLRRRDADWRALGALKQSIERVTSALIGNPNSGTRGFP
jgi:hypothetical protein